MLTLDQLFNHNISWNDSIFNLLWNVQTCSAQTPPRSTTNVQYWWCSLYMALAAESAVNNLRNNRLKQTCNHRQTWCLTTNRYRFIVKVCSLANVFEEYIQLQCYYNVMHFTLVLTSNPKSLYTTWEVMRWAVYETEILTATITSGPAYGL